MPLTDHAELPIVDNEGLSRGSLYVRLLPKTALDSSPPPLLDLRNERDRDTSLEAVQLLEGIE
ncbi:MAG: hypothetical protein V3T10_01590, partial [Candidatus Bathyarchaeia archaeon]